MGSRRAHNLYTSGLRLQKPWGTEVLIARAADLELWELRMDAGSKTSLHLHPGKHTGLICLSGGGRLVLDSTVVSFGPTDCHFIAAAMPHRLEAHEDAVVWELESPPDKEDIDRLEDQHGRAGKPFLFGSTVLSEREVAAGRAPPRELLNRLLSLFAEQGVWQATDGTLGDVTEAMMVQAARWSVARA